MFNILAVLLFTLSFSQSLFISEYSEGSSYNKYVEIYNPTDSDVDLSNYQIWKISNGGDWEEGAGNSLSLEGSIQSYGVFVICHTSVDESIISMCDILNGSQSMNFNGDDAVGLAFNLELIDQVGDAGDDPGSGWEVAGVSDATKDHTLVRKSNIIMGNTDWISSAGSSMEDSEWEVYPQNTFSFLGWHIDGGGNIITGCTDPIATNYNPDATLDDGSCEYQALEVSIYDIQGQTDSSPYIDQIVSTSGIVTGVSYNGFFIQDGMAEWSGIWVYGMSDNLSVGDLIIVTGSVLEYNDLTEISAMSVAVESSNNATPTPIVLNTGDIGESYESVLVNVMGTATTNPNEYGEWSIDDGSGALGVDDKLFAEADDLIEVGNQYVVTGPVDFTYGIYKIQPRSAEDVYQFVQEGIPVANAGDDQAVDVSSLVTLDGTSSYDSDGILLGYSWSQVSGPMVDVDNYEQSTIVFTAPDEFCTIEFSLQVYDDEFNFSSLDYVVITVGSLGIYDIQYTVDQGEYCYETMMTGSEVTVSGLVTHVSSTGQFFLQDPDYDTWSGIYVYDTTVQPMVGDELILSASVNEYYSLTQLLDVTSYSVISSGNSFDPILLGAEDIGIECSMSGESYESMLVTLADITFDSVDEYGNWTISDMSGSTMVDDYYFDDSLGSWPTLSAGDTYDCLIGIVSYSYSEFKVYPRNINDFECLSDDCLSNGDVNFDNNTDVLDIVSIVGYILGNNTFTDDQLCTSDVNQDENVDVLDIVLVVSTILGNI